MKSFAFNLKHIISVVLLFFAFSSTAMEEENLPESKNIRELLNLNIVTGNLDPDLLKKYLLSLSIENLQDIIKNIKTDVEYSVIVLIVKYIDANLPLGKTTKEERKNCFLKFASLVGWRHIRGDFIKLTAYALTHVGFDDPKYFMENQFREREFITKNNELSIEQTLKVGSTEMLSLINDKPFYFNEIIAFGQNIRMYIRAISTKKTKEPQTTNWTLNWSEIDSSIYQLWFFICFHNPYVKQGAEITCPVEITINIRGKNGNNRRVQQYTIDKFKSDMDMGSHLMPPNKSCKDISEVLNNDDNLVIVVSLKFLGEERCGNYPAVLLHL